MTDKDSAFRTGHCLCGAVRYRVPSPRPEDIAHCHCSMCRRIAGAVAVTWFTVPTETLEMLGAPLEIYYSSSEVERGFCPTCHTPISFWSSRFPDTIDVTLATLDDPAEFAPSMHIWTESRLPWLNLDTHLPDREGDPDEDVV